MAQGDKLSQLEEQIAKLQAEAEQLRIAQRADGLAEIRALMAKYGISARDIARGSVKGPTRRKSAKANFYNPDTGETWSGRGRRAKWLDMKIAEGRDIEEFRVK